MSSQPANRILTAQTLALYGGAPVRDRWLPYGRHGIDEDDIAAVVEVLRSDWITQGPKVEEFERAVADYCEAKYAVAFSSGTAALHAACRVAGLGPGDEAITTPLTFVATANAVVYCGAKPVFADIERATLNVDPASIEKRITSKTKAILPVDFAGLPVDLDLIKQIAARHRLIVIEDAAHALGAVYKGRKVGSIADMTVFSFHPVKLITSGEGGMVVTDDQDLAERLRALRHHGIRYDAEKPWQYQVVEMGYNYRLSDIHCALGLSQLRKVEERRQKRQALAMQYQRALAGLREITLPVWTHIANHAWHLFMTLLDLQLLTVNRDVLVERLRTHNIGVTVHYPLVHLHPFYRQQFGYEEGLCPVAEGLSQCMMTLPLFSEMSPGDIGDVVATLRKVLEFSRKSGMSSTREVV